MRVSRNLQTVQRDGLRSIAKALDRGLDGHDEFNEIPRLKREGRRSAAALGHKLGHWKARPYAPRTTATAWCARCLAPAYINLDNGARVYGQAVEKECN